MSADDVVSCFDAAVELEARQRAAVAREAEQWLRTPYHDHARLKGVGVDCAMLNCEVYERAGVVGHVDPGDYEPQWGLHRDEEKYIAMLLHFGFHEVQTPGLGDIAVFKFGRTFSHGGIFVGPDLLVHAYINAHVMHTRLTEAPLADRPVKFFSFWGA